MYYSSVGDAAFLDSIADRATEAFDDLTSSAKSEAERVAKETIATIVPSTPAPRVGLSSAVRGPRTRIVAAPRPVLSGEPRPFGAAPLGGRGPLPLTTAPFRSVSDQPTPFGAAPFQPASTMVGPNLEVVSNYNQSGPRVMASAAPAGMSTGTMVAIGAVVLVGLYFATQK